MSILLKTGRKANVTLSLCKKSLSWSLSFEREGFNNGFKCIVAQHRKIKWKQVCISVGCVTPASVAATRCQSKGSLSGGVSVRGCLSGVGGSLFREYLPKGVCVWGDGGITIQGRLSMVCHGGLCLEREPSVNRMTDAINNELLAQRPNKSPSPNSYVSVNDLIYVRGYKLGTVICDRNRQQGYGRV